MSHIHGHVDNGNPVAEGYIGSFMSATLKAKFIDQLPSAPPYAVARFDFKDNEGNTVLIPIINTLGVNLALNTEIGFHICLTTFDEKEGKFLAYGYDVIPLKDHKDAEEQGAPALRKKFKKDHAKLEQFTPDEVADLANTFDEERLKRVARQTSEYMKTDFYKFLYTDGNGKLRDDANFQSHILSNIKLKRK